MQVKITKSGCYYNGRLSRGMTIEIPPNRLSEFPTDSYELAEARKGKVRITKTVTCNYGTFTKGREVDLPPNMLARLPKDSYTPVETSYGKRGRKW